MSLAEDLEKLMLEITATVPRETLAVMGRAMGRLKGAGVIDNCLRVGDRAPEFSLPNVQAEMVSSGDILARGAMVLSFYRGVWCPFCNLELQALQLRQTDMEMRGAKLVAVSPQLPDNSLATAEILSLTFEVVSDVGNNVARQFGIVFTLPEEMRQIYSGFGIDLPAANGDETFELPVPATYVINREGIIAHAYVDIDHTKRLEPETIIGVLNELR